ncbi:hypothetical protein E3E23_08820 [Thermococcus sp. CX2]|uniref:hypothetical protein n=1 Tax=Thermococcus sp. CX2 TaxID=163006 RepID=UPI00143B2A85|nr:hypothetical protein [Thermococcus sp. CX2]NJE85923.1 hypothetical protein [Thermococcus sp. CX2]
MRKYQAEKLNSPLSRWRIDPATAVIVGGLWGVLTEQAFAGFFILLSGSPTFIPFALMVFSVYGFFVLASLLLYREELSETGRESRWAPVVLFVMMLVVSIGVWFLWDGFLSLFGFEGGG